MAIDRYELVIPSAPNIINMVNTNIVENLRRRQNSDIELPSLYRLAYAMHYNTGELYMKKSTVEEGEE